MTKPILDIEQLYREQHSRLIKFIHKYTRDESAAEDIAQISYCEAIRSANNFSGLSAPSTWLFSIAINVSKNYLKKKIDRSGVSLQEDKEEGWLEDLVGNEVDPAIWLEHNQFLKLVIEKLVAETESSTLKCFELVCIDGLSYRDAADILDIPLGTVRSKICRLRSKLKEQFQQ